MSLNFQLKDKHFGQTVADYIQTVSGELDIDAVGLWQIVAAGKKAFGLEKEDLNEFVERCIFELIKNGAKPARGGDGVNFDWVIQNKYGKNDDEIIANVMKEWLRSSGECDPGGIWFARPSLDVICRFE